MNGLKILWGFCTTAGTNVTVNFNSLCGISFSARDRYFIWLQDSDDKNPRTTSSNSDTGGYDMVSGVDRQETTFFTISKTNGRTVYWFIIGY